MSERMSDKRLRGRICEWEPHDDTWDDESWQGQCGIIWIFMEGGPVENEVNFCPQCGGKLVIAEARGGQKDGG